MTFDFPAPARGIAAEDGSGRNQPTGNLPHPSHLSQIAIEQVLALRLAQGFLISLGGSAIDLGRRQQHRLLTFHAHLAASGRTGRRTANREHGGQRHVPAASDVK